MKQKKHPQYFSTEPKAMQPSCTEPNPRGTKGKKQGGGRKEKKKGKGGKGGKKGKKKKGGKKGGKKGKPRPRLLDEAMV